MRLVPRTLGVCCRAASCAWRSVESSPTATKRGEAGRGREGGEATVRRTGLNDNYAGCRHTSISVLGDSRAG